MRLSLQPHSEKPAPAITIEAELQRFRERVQLSFLVTGNLDAISLPRQDGAARSDQLWLHTCFELFARPDPDGPYLECNYAPSGAWAAYRLRAYRSGMEPALVEAPAVTARKADGSYRIDVVQPLAAPPDLPADRRWLVGMSAVIEEVSGRKTYWALAHPPGQPDFHHPDCFALELPPPTRP